MKKSFKAPLAVYLAALLAVVLALAALVFVVPAFQKADETVIKEAADWMAAVPDSTPLNCINIPGTHESATQYAQFPFFSRCQGKSILNQLQDGYRFLDIGLGIDTVKGHTALKLMNGAADCRADGLFSTKDLYLKKVLAQCYAFLDLHPTETILFAVKQAAESDSLSEFQMLLNSYILQDPEYWLLTDEIPTMGQSRGRLVLLRRYEDVAELGSDAGIALIWAEQPGFESPSLSYERNENEGITLWVQDRYEFDNEEKWLSFLTCLTTCPGDAAKGDVCLNFLSTRGSYSFGHPYGHAKRLNANLADISIVKGNWYGWVIMDFGTAGLAGQIYSTNFTE